MNPRAKILVSTVALAVVLAAICLLPNDSRGRRVLAGAEDLAALPDGAAALPSDPAGAAVPAAGAGGERSPRGLPAPVHPANSAYRLGPHGPFPVSYMGGSFTSPQGAHALSVGAHKNLI